MGRKGTGIFFNRDFFQVFQQGFFAYRVFFAIIIVIITWELFNKLNDEHGEEEKEGNWFFANIVTMCHHHHQGAF